MGLEEKEAAIRDALTRLSIENKAQSVTLKKQGNTAVVFINGQYFDIYDFGMEQFINHVPSPPCAEKCSEPAMSASIYSDTRLNDQYYVGAQLALPASADDVNLAFEQAGITGPEDCRIEFLSWKDYIFDFDEITEATITELNFFAKRIAGMDEETLTAFEGCLIINQKYLSIKDLINLTYSLGNCRVLHGITNDAELGNYYAEHGMIKDLANIPETVLAFIDYEKIGKSMRETENGVFLNGRYITHESNELSQVYDGETLPEIFFDSAFTVYIPSDGGMEEKSLKLPADQGQIADFLKELENVIVSCNNRALKALAYINKADTPNTNV